MTAPATTALSAAPTDRWVPDDSTFGARLALIRQKMGWGNVAEAARACGLDRASWRLWEQTLREPRHIVTIAMTIATRTGVDPEWLLMGPSRADLERRAQLTERYVSDWVATGDPTRPILDLSPDPAGARLVAQIGHGDFRTGPRRIPRPRGRSQTVRSRTA